MRRSPASNSQHSRPTTALALGALSKAARDIMREDKRRNGDLDRLPAFGVASDVPPLQGGRELLGGGYLGLRSALHPRLSHDGLSALTLRAFDLPPF